jgi:beta-N-acetylhexosaminidase
MNPRALIVGLSGPTLNVAEQSFLRAAQPFGLILFKRNVENPQNVQRLTSDFRDAVGWNAPVLVDQEGGRVQRLGPPHWPAYPAAAVYGRIYDVDHAKGLEAARTGARLMASDLVPLGIDVDCLPVADVPVPGSDGVIGDRAYGSEPGKVAALAGAAADGLLDAGVLPVLKHLPGHGRATVDSHKSLPVVEASRADLDGTDFDAFRPLADLPLGMTAHVVFRAIDPVAPATTSAIMINQVIRGSIGFTGLLMSDDISMGALQGPLRERARAACAAGCDIVLHCNGDLAEMEDLAATSGLLEGEAKQRADAALARRSKMQPIDVETERQRFAFLMQTASAGMTA